MEKKWTEMSSEERRQQRFDQWLSPPDVQFITPEAESSYKKTVQRLIDSINLKKPDRTPLSLDLKPAVLKYSGLTEKDAMYDCEKTVDAFQKFMEDKPLEIDEIDNGFGIASLPGRVLEMVDYNLYKWPGYGVPDDAGFQFNEGEYMHADEYDLLIQDPTDFWLRTYMPRIFGTLGAFKKLIPLTELIEIPGTPAILSSLGRPEVKTALKSLMDAGTEALEWENGFKDIRKLLLESGFTGFHGGYARAPFDTIGDTLRGTQGIIMDMYRIPEKLLQALESVTQREIRRAAVMSKMARPGMPPFIFFPLHKGADGFMSEDQFMTFYWPFLKRVIRANIDEGFVPLLFAEGGYNSRLNLINDLPKGKVLWYFDQTDMKAAKEIIGSTQCIMGNIPASLLITGTPGEVKKYCRELIETAGKGGGYILAPGSVGVGANLDNLNAVIESVRE